MFNGIQYGKVKISSVYTLENGLFFMSKIWYSIAIEKDGDYSVMVSTRVCGTLSSGSNPDSHTRVRDQKGDRERSKSLNNGS